MNIKRKEIKSLFKHRKYVRTMLRRFKDSTVLGPSLSNTRMLYELLRTISTSNCPTPLFHPSPIVPVPAPPLEASGGLTVVLDFISGFLFGFTPVKFVFTPPILTYHALSSYVIETRLFTNVRKSRKLAGFGIYAAQPLHLSCSNTCTGQEASSNRTFVAQGVYVFMRNSLSVPLASQILRGFD